MALKNPSLFLYGFTINANNQNISFQAVSAGPVLTAVIPTGNYSLSSLETAIAVAMSGVDSANEYTVSDVRTYSGGTQNRVTIATSGSFLSLLFSTGNVSNPASLLGFSGNDLTGSTSYTGSSTAGTALIPNQLGYSFLPPQAMQKNFGQVNVSASGLKESIVFNLQSFWQVQFKYIPESVMENSWLPLVQWMIQQNEFEFTPDITAGGTFFVGTLDDPAKGLEFNFTEHLSEGLPFEYYTPLMKFRVRNNT